MGLLLALLLAQSGFGHIAPGTKFILYGLGERKEINLKKDQLAKAGGTCDIAVRVVQGFVEKGEVRMQLLSIGRPDIPGQPRRACGQTPDAYDLRVSGFAPDEPLDSVNTALEGILKTPEQYLAARGVRYDLPLDPPSEAFYAHPTYGGAGTIQPSLVLHVEPTYSEQARQAKVQGSLRIQMVVGADGRPYKPNVSTPFGYGLDEMALEAVSLWRFQPCRKDGVARPTVAVVETTFRLL